MDLFKLSLRILIGIVVGFAAVEIIEPITTGGKILLIFVSVVVVSLTVSVIKRIWAPNKKSATRTKT